MKKIIAKGLSSEAMAIRVQSSKADLKAERAERDADMLTTLHFTCPVSGKSFEHDVPGNATALKDLWSRQLRLSCPHCPEVHDFPFRAAYVRAVLEDRASHSSVAAVVWSD